MKKSILLLAVLLFAGANFAQASEPLLLEPLNSTILSSSPANYNETTVYGQMKSPIGGGVYEATYMPSSMLVYGENMVPQNAAAKGEPIPEQREPVINIQTKQRSQGNAYWNPGGKGTKSFF